MRTHFISCFLFIGSSLLGGCDETERSRYDTVAEARSAGLFVRGWAPDLLPENAGPLVEAHNLDTNARCFHAAFAADSLTAVQSALVRGGFAEAPRSSSRRSPEGFCPFSESDFEGAVLWNRDSGEWGPEYAVLRADGVIYYWSSGTTSR